MGIGLLLSCGGGAGGDPVDRMIYHFGQMINILKTNKDDPDAASEKIEQYAQKIEAEMESLQDDMEKLGEDYILKNAAKFEQFYKKVEELMALALELGVSVGF